MRLRAISDAKLGVVAAVFCAVVSYAVIARLVPGKYTDGGGRVVTVELSDSRQLRPGNPVRINGVRVGDVDKIEAAADRRSALIDLELDDGAGPIYRDARASVSFRSLLGGAFVVEIDRGYAKAGELGSATIPASQTSTQVELDEVTSVLRGDAITGLKTLPDELARTLRDPAPTNDLLAAVAEEAPSLGRGLEAVQGSRPDDLETLVRQTDRTVRALDAPGRRLRDVVAGAASFVQTTAAREAELRSTLDRAPALMDNTVATMQGLDGTLRVANPLLERLLVAAADVAPTVAGLRGTVVPADRLAQDAVPLLKSLRPALRSLSTASRLGRPLLQRLEPTIKRADQTLLPYMAQDDPGTGLSLGEMVGPAAAGLSGIGAYVDNAGRYVRFPATSGNNAFYLPCQTYFNNPDKERLIACESLQQAASRMFGLRPLTRRPR